MGNIWMVSNGEKDEDLPVLASFLLLQINTLTRTNLREKRIYLACTFRLQSTISGSQGKNSRQEPESKPMEEGCVLALSKTHCLVSFLIVSYVTRPPPVLGWYCP